MSGTCVVVDGVVIGFTGRTKANLTSIVLPPEAVAIGEAVFDGCTKLKTVTKALGGSMQFSYAINSIQPLAFFGCTSLTTVPTGSVFDIGTKAFAGCTSLATLDLTNLKIIGDAAFAGCTKLTYAIISKGFTDIGISCFDKTPYLPTWAANLPILIAGGAVQPVESTVPEAV